MNDTVLYKKLFNAIWIAHSLFERGKTSGSTANLSFLHEDKMYITGSGTCFGTISENSFAVVDLNGQKISKVAPSKEYPMHLMMYKNNKSIGAVIHTHSFYSTLWSCYCNNTEQNAIPSYTPYLSMKLGEIALVPYAPPGSQQLFETFQQHLCDSKGYLLRHHGPIVGDTDLMAAFYGLEELEESAHIAWELRKETVEVIK